MYSASSSVLIDITKDKGCTVSQRGEADAAYHALLSFEFAFILHIMQEIMGITNGLCQHLQNQSQDILNAIQLVKTTKALIQDLRDNGWSLFLDKVTSFCRKEKILVPNLHSWYSSGRSAREKKDKVTVEHHYRFDIFHETIDTQWQELDHRFNEDTLQLFTLSSSLEPKDAYKSFNISNICELVDTFYPQDFSEQEKLHLKYQLQHYGLDVPNDDQLKYLSTISELCQGLARTNKSNIYPLVDRLIRLVLTLPVSTATTERAFSATKLVKTSLRNKMEDEFLADSMTVYIEKEIAIQFNNDSIIEEFDKMKTRRVQLMQK